MIHGLKWIASPLKNMVGMANLLHVQSTTKMQTEFCSIIDIIMICISTIVTILSGKYTIKCQTTAKFMQN
jgi:hypothetical protein